jgi:hypothetical protein
VVERLAVNEDVVGSSPSGGAKEKHQPRRWCFCLGARSSLNGMCLCFDAWARTLARLHRHKRLKTERFQWKSVLEAMNRLFV